MILVGNGNDLTIFPRGVLSEQIIGNHNTSLDWHNYYSKMGQDSYETRYSSYQETFAICDPTNAKRLLAVGTNT